ncbi:lecithin retinol acyltransferase b, tandem duplicate 2 [Alosa pseudoharengus]|uniref:lecithin retinol acyltransferase b, tandem duplicate 2 n=1 Tax=Alosa pseudoharengus TaxID=34774 RepID=UPI003F8C7EED
MTTTTKQKQVQEQEEVIVKDKKRKYDISLYKRGDLLEVPRTMFTHFGIYLGNDRVGHLIPDILPLFTSDRSSIDTMVTNLRLILGAITKVASVRVDSVEDFAYGGDILINPMDGVCSRQPYDGEEVARRAEKLIGPVSYSLLWYNCEHYVMYCRYGTNMSFQTFQFCKAVRKIFCSKRFSLVSALIGVAIMFYLQTDPFYTLLPTFFISFHIWMAS